MATMKKDDQKKNLHLNMPSRHVYDSDELEPAFEPPTPMRYNLSLPEDIGQWRKGENKKYFGTASTTQKFHNPELDFSISATSTSPPVDPTFYPSRRFQQTDQSEKSVSSKSSSSATSPYALDNEKQYFFIHDHGATQAMEKSDFGKKSLADSVVQRGLTVANLEKIAGLDNKSASLPGSNQASPSPRSRFSPRIFSGGNALGNFLGSKTSDKKVEISNFDLSVIAPTSM